MNGRCSREICMMPRAVTFAILAPCATDGAVLPRNYPRLLPVGSTSRAPNSGHWEVHSRVKGRERSSGMLCKLDCFPLVVVDSISSECWIHCRIDELNGFEDISRMSNCSSRSKDSWSDECTEGWGYLALNSGQSSLLILCLSTLPQVARWRVREPTFKHARDRSGVC